MKLAYACPYYGNTPPLHGDSVRANIINAQEAGHTWIDDYSVSGTQHRNACEAIAFKAAHDPRIDAVFWTEHDVVLPPDAVVRLCESLEAMPEADTVTGIAFRRSEPYNPMVAKLDRSLTPEAYEKLKESPEYNVRRAATLMSYEEMREKVLMSIHVLDSSAPPFEVDTASMCCALFRKSVFEKVWEIPDLFAVDPMGFFSIDNAFFLRLKDKGLRLFCDPRVLCGHLGDPEMIDARKWMENVGRQIDKFDLRKQLEMRKGGNTDRIYGELTRLANKCGTDKGTLDHRPDSGWQGWVHNYCDFYETMLDPLRLSARRVLEIGVWHGASLQMWAEYFPNAEVYGIDVDLSQVRKDLGARIHVIEGNVMDRGLDIGAHGPFDLIVDDGSHVMEEQQTALARLFPSVRPGGWYILEDLHTSFLALANEAGGPFGLDDDASNATIKVVEDLAHGRPIQSRYMSAEEVAYLEQNVAWARVYGKRSITSMLQKRG